jgi:hypothetical protein
MERDTTHLNGFFEGVPMSSLERARAIEGMQQGMLLAELTLKACDYVRNVFKPNAHATVRSAAGGRA